jgi:hypothetical protein
MPVMVTGREMRWASRAVNTLAPANLVKGRSAMSDPNTPTVCPQPQPISTRPHCHDCHDEVIGEVFALYLEAADGTSEEVPVCTACFYREHFSLGAGEEPWTWDDVITLAPEVNDATR